MAGAFRLPAAAGPGAARNGPRRYHQPDHPVAPPGRNQILRLRRHVTLRLAPSVLNADLANLAEQVGAVEGDADWVHLDLMDGHFVPNLTFGPPVVAALRGHTRAFFDCHLMVSDPVALLPALAEARVDLVSMHVEALADPAGALAAAADHGIRAGLALRPRTPLEAVLPWLDRVDLVLPMTVEPGFGGQAFMADQLPKLTTARAAIDRSGREIALQVDGGVNGETIDACLDAGADVFVVGSAIFAAADPAAAAKGFRARLDRRAGGRPPPPGAPGDGLPQPPTTTRR